MRVLLTLMKGATAWVSQTSLCLTRHTVGQPCGHMFKIINPADLSSGVYYFIDLILNARRTLLQEFVAFAVNCKFSERRDDEKQPD